MKGVDETSRPARGGWRKCGPQAVIAARCYIQVHHAASKHKGRTRRQNERNDSAKTTKAVEVKLSEQLQQDLA
jgi:hypothetical protein